MNQSFDKFKIIKNNNMLLDSKHFYKKIKDYVEMYMLYDNTIFSPSLIHNFLYDQINNEGKDVNKIFDEIKVSLNNAFSILMKNIKSNVLKVYRSKYSKYNLNDFINMLDLYIDKLSLLIDTFIIIDANRYVYNSNDNKTKSCWGNSKIFELFINKLCLKLLSDPLIKLMLLHFMNTKDELENKYIYNFYKRINKFIFYYNNINIWFNDLVVQYILDNKPSNEYFYLIDDNQKIISQIYKLSDLINYIGNFKEKFLYIKDNKLYDCIFNEINKEYKILYKYLNNIEIDVNIIYNIIKNNKKLFSIVLNYDKDNFFEFVLLMKKIVIDDFISFCNFIDFLIDTSFIFTYNVENIDNHFVNIDSMLILVNEIFNNVNEDILIKNLLLYLDNFLLNNQYDKKIIINILYFVFIKIKNKDIFIKKYEQCLILRLLNNHEIMLNLNLDNEVNVLKNLLNFKDNNTSRLYCILDDFRNSKFERTMDFLWDFDKKNNTEIMCNIECLIIETSFNKWNINLIDGYLDIDKLIKSELYKKYHWKDDLDCIVFINSYNEYFKNTLLESVETFNKILIWYPHIGKIVCDFNNNEIIMLPIHNIFIKILDYEDNYDNIIDYFLSISSYSYKFLKNILDSLIKSDIYNIVNSKIIPNFDYSGNLDLIKIYYSLSNFELKLEEKVKDELAYDRVMIVSTCINSMLKAKHCINNTYYSISSLENDLIETISHFDINKKILDESLEYMVKRDYIAFNDDKEGITKLLF